MRRAVWFVLWLMLSTAQPAAATVVEGVRFAPSLSAAGETLALNGAGLLVWKWVIKAYVAALYLGDGAPAAEVFADVPKRIELEYFYAIDAEDFGKATWERLGLALTPSSLERLRPQIDALNALYVDVIPGDRYALTYVPGRGTELTLNGRVLGNVPGLDVANAVFGIWIGDVPVDEPLKQALLGR